MELPKWSASFVLAIKGQPDESYTYLGELPREYVDEFEKIIGNSLAKVSVSMDMGIKDFGTGGSAMCSVTLSCNQDQASINRAAELAAGAAKWFASKYRAEADGEIQKILASRQPALPSNPNYG
jgi:hypothetical protein